MQTEHKRGWLEKGSFLQITVNLSPKMALLSPILGVISKFSKAKKDLAIYRSQWSWKPWRQLFEYFHLPHSFGLSKALVKSLITTLCHSVVISYVTKKIMGEKFAHFHTVCVQSVRSFYNFISSDQFPQGNLRELEGTQGNL